MTNRELLRLLLLDKIKKDCLGTDCFKHYVYQKEFMDTVIETWDGFCFTIRAILFDMDKPSLAMLKRVYAVFLEIKEKDKRY